MKTIILYGLKRSGNHFLISTILQQFSNCVHINNVKLSYDKYIEWKNIEKTKERIDQAYKRIKELFLLINVWTRGVKETNSEYVEIKKRKQEIIDDLYLELGQLNQIWTEQEIPLSDKDYVVKFDDIKQRIKDLKK